MIIYIHFYSSFENAKHGRNKNMDEYVIIKKIMFTVNAGYHIISSRLMKWIHSLGFLKLEVA